MAYKYVRDENKKLVKVLMTEDEEREQSRRLAPMRAAHEDARARGLGVGKGGAGEVACPNCKGKIRYAVASCNGHMHGACTTPGCAAWME